MKCAVSLGTVQVGDTELVIECTLEDGHEKPYRPECSCGRHNVDWWSEGRQHEMKIRWGTVPPIPEEDRE